jgi:hypothetical protein
MSRPLLLLLLLLAAPGCSTLNFLPSDAAATLANPSHVEAYRTGTIDDHPGFGGKMDGFAVFGTGQTSPDSAKSLAATVSDPATYRDATRNEDFTPTLGYRFYRRLPSGRGQLSVDVLINFDSDEVLLIARDAGLHEVFRRRLEFDPARLRLLEISRDSFPFDQLVQSLSEVRTPSAQPDD